MRVCQEGAFWMRIDKNELRMIWQLARNDLKSRYANFHFGILWAFILPLVTILVFWFVFEAGLRNQPVGNVPYILWFAAAYIPWTVFQDILNSGTNCLMEYSYLVKKIKFNVTIIPVIKLLSALFIYLFFLVFLLFLYFCYQVTFTIYLVQIFYYSFAMAMFALGLVYLFSALAVFFKDTSSVINVVLQIGFWVTPVLWNEQTVKNELVAKILSINPMYYIVSGFRDSLINGRWFWGRNEETVFFWVITIIVLFLGTTTFNRLRPLFADEV